LYSVAVGGDILVGAGSPRTVLTSLRGHATRTLVTSQEQQRSGWAIRPGEVRSSSARIDIQATRRGGRPNRNSQKKEERKYQMTPSTKDQIEGTLHDLKGNIKKKVGKVTNNPKLTAQGQVEQFAGKVQKKAGQIEKVLEK
jgi:uncharacterized protein YjbJ (UPF0337 family)